MKKILLTFLVSMPSLLLAANNHSYIKCYNYDKIVYQGYVTDIAYEDDIFSFVEEKSRKIYITNALCVVRISK